MGGSITKGTAEFSFASSLKGMTGNCLAFSGNHLCIGVGAGAGTRNTGIRPSISAIVVGRWGVRGVWGSSMAWAIAKVLLCWGG